MTDQASTRHTEDKIDVTNFAHHIVTPKTYLIVLIILFVLTYFTVDLAYRNFSGLWNLVIALGVATVKATVVALYFMHVRYSGRLIHIIIFATLLFFFLLLFGTLSDFWTRGDRTVHTGYEGAKVPEPTFVQRDKAAVEPGGEQAVSH